MQIQSAIRDGQAVMSLAGTFDFNAHRDFRQAYEELLEAQGVRSLELDFARVDYVDSSALGMLLILRDKAEARGKQVILSRPRGTVRQVLEIANFGKLFPLRD
ncbi:MAG: STAS domain-containing protein [Thiobacillaceae bacterium]